MGRFEQRRERNKQIIADVDNFIFDNKKIWDKDIANGMPNDEDHKDGFIKSTALRFHVIFFNRGWCWVDLVTVLNLIRNKMIDLEKSSEFEELYNEYKPEDEKEVTGSFGKWDFICIFTFASHLLIDFPEVIQAIAKDQEKVME